MAPNASNLVNPISNPASIGNRKSSGTETWHPPIPNMNLSWNDQTIHNSHPEFPLPAPVSSSASYSKYPMNGIAMYPTHDPTILQTSNASKRITISSNDGGAQNQQSDDIDNALLEVERHYYPLTELPGSVTPSSTYQQNSNTTAYSHHFPHNPAYSYFPTDSYTSNDERADHWSDRSGTSIGMDQPSVAPTSKDISTVTSKSHPPQLLKATLGASKDTSIVTKDEAMLNPLRRAGKWTSTEISVLKYWQQDDMREALALNLSHKEIAEEVHKEIVWLRKQKSPGISLPITPRTYNANIVGHKLTWLDNNPNQGANPLAPRNPERRTTYLKGPIRARRRAANPIKLESSRVESDGNSNVDRGTAETATQKPQVNMVGEAVLSRMGKATNSPPSGLPYSSKDKFQRVKYSPRQQSTHSKGISPNSGELHNTGTPNAPRRHGVDNHLIKTAFGALMQTTGFSIKNQHSSGDPPIDLSLFSVPNIQASRAVAAGNILDNFPAQVDRIIDKQSSQALSGNGAAQNGSLAPAIDFLQRGLTQRSWRNGNVNASSTRLNRDDDSGGERAYKSVNEAQYHSLQNQFLAFQSSGAITESTISNFAKYGLPPTKPIFSNEDVSEQLQINTLPQQSLSPDSDPNEPSRGRESYDHDHYLQLYPRVHSETNTDVHKRYSVMKALRDRRYTGAAQQSSDDDSPQGSEQRQPFTEADITAAIHAQQRARAQAQRAMLYTLSTAPTQQTRVQAQAQAQSFPGYNGVSQPRELLANSQPRSGYNSPQGLGTPKSGHGAYRFNGEPVHGFVRTFDHDEMRRQYNDQNTISKSENVSSIPLLATKAYQEFTQAHKDMASNIGSTSMKVDYHDKTGDDYRAKQQISASSQLLDETHSEMPGALSQLSKHPATYSVPQNGQPGVYSNSSSSLLRRQDIAPRNDIQQAQHFHPAAQNQHHSLFSHNPVASQQASSNHDVPLSSSKQQVSGPHADGPAAKKQKAAGWGFINGDNYDYLNGPSNQQQTRRPNFGNYNTQAGPPSKQTPLTGINYEDPAKPTQGLGVTGIGGVQYKRSHDDVNAGGDSAPQKQLASKQATDRVILQTRPPLSSSRSRSKKPKGSTVAGNVPSKQLPRSSALKTGKPAYAAPDTGPQTTTRKPSSEAHWYSDIGKLTHSSILSKVAAPGVQAISPSNPIINQQSAKNMKPNKASRAMNSQENLPPTYTMSAGPAGHGAQAGQLLPPSQPARPPPAAQGETPLFIYRGEGKVSFINTEGTLEKHTWADEANWMEKMYSTGFHPRVASAYYPPSLVGQPLDRITGYPPLDLAPRLQWNKEFEEKQKKEKRKRDGDEVEQNKAKKKRGEDV